MSDETPWMLSKALIGVSSPDSPSKPKRDRRSLFINQSIFDKSKNQLSGVVSSDSDSLQQPSDEIIPNSDELIDTHNSIISVRSAKPKATPSFPSHSNTISNTLKYIPKTPPFKKKRYVRNSWQTHTDPGHVKARRQHSKDSKKRRVSFFPSLEVKEYIDSSERESYLIPLDGSHSLREKDSLLQSNESDSDVVQSDVPSSSDPLQPTRPQDVAAKLANSDAVLYEIYPETGSGDELGSETSGFDYHNTKSARDTSLVIPEHVKEQLAKIVKHGQISTHGNRSMITEYARLHTPKNLSPIRKKLTFPPVALDPLHPSLKFPRNKNNDVIKLSIENDDAIIPISFIKKWYSKYTDNAFLPLSFATSLQNYSTDLIEHLVGLIYEQSKKDSKGYAHATPHDACVVMKRYLGLDDSVNIANLISTHLPMELWFEYNDEC